MKRKRSSEFYLVIIIVAILIIAISAIIFSRYLEDRTRSTVEVSSYIGLESSAPSTRPADEVTPTTVAPTTTSRDTVSSNANDILQLLSQSVNNPEQIEVIYEQFTDSQIDGVSLEEYQIYISLLSEVIGTNIQAYSTMSYSEEQALKNSVLSHDENYASFLNNASFHWLEYRVAEDIERMPMVVSVDDSNSSYLSSEWIRGSMELKNYTDLYFAALFNNNFETLYNLTYSASLDDDVRLEKTNELLAFYDNYVTIAGVSEVMISSIRLDEITYRIPLSTNLPSLNNWVNLETDASAEREVNEDVRFDSGAARENYHEVTIYKRGDRFIPVDAIPSNAWKYDAVAYDGEDARFAVGDTITLGELVSDLSWPKEQEAYVISYADGSQDDYFRLKYNDVELVVEFVNNVEASDISNETEIRLIGYVLVSDRYSVAGQYQIGMNLRTLLSHYLYIDVLNYSYEDDDSNTVELRLDEGNRVVRIVVRDRDYARNIELYGTDDVYAVDLFENVTIETTPSETTSSTGTN